MKPIALIGFRGSGKTTIGRRLANLLGGTFIDTDERIVQQTGATIAEIFRDRGEEEFRRLESLVLTEALAQAPTVLGVGGGALLDRENVQQLKEKAVLVWLRAPADVLWKRIASDPHSMDARPDLTAEGGLREVEQLLSIRSAVYAENADLIVDTEDKEPEEIACEILKRVSG